MSEHIRVSAGCLVGCHHGFGSARGTVPKGIQTVRGTERLALASKNFTVHKFVVGVITFLYIEERSFLIVN